jgi:hypothetical protein
MKLSFLYVAYLCAIILVFLNTTCGYVRSQATIFSRRLVLKKLYSTPTDSGSPTSTTPAVNNSALKAKLMEDMKDSMRNKEKQRLAAIRSVQAAIKQKEVDERIELT